MVVVRSTVGALLTLGARHLSNTVMRVHSSRRRMVTMAITAANDSIIIANGNVDTMLATPRGDMMSAIAVRSRQVVNTDVADVVDRSTSRGLKLFDGDLKEVLRCAFRELDERLISFLTTRSEFESAILHGRGSAKSCGTTVTVCLLRGHSELFVGHVGDSRATLCRRDAVDGMVLTNDHCLDDPVELDRILRCSGHVTRSNMWGPPRVNGILDMTRSFGDVLLKQYGVTAEPEVTKIELDSSRDEFLALTTDGVHNTLKTSEILGAVSGCGHCDADDAAALLADDALFYGSDDNCTAIVVPLAAWKSNANPSLVVQLSRYRNIFGNR